MDSKKDLTLKDITYPDFGAVIKGARQPNFWAPIEYTKDKDLLTYQNDIIQTCNPYDIITRCDFTSPTQLIIGTGGWRATNENNEGDCDCGPYVKDPTTAIPKSGEICNGKANQDIYRKKYGPFANPQVVNPDVTKNSAFQWVLTVNVNNETGLQIPSKKSKTEVTAVPGKCITCRINKVNVGLSWDKFSDRLGDECHDTIYFPKEPKKKETNE